MINRPNFKPCYHVEGIAPDKVLFLSERGVSWLDNHLYYLMVSLVDGHRTTEEIFDLLQQHLVQGQIFAEDSRIEFQQVLDMSMRIQRSLFQLERQGYLVEKSQALPPQATIFCNHLNISPTLAYERLQSTKVVVKTIGSVPTESLINLLNSLSIQVAAEGDLRVWSKPVGETGSPPAPSPPWSPPLGEKKRKGGAWKVPQMRGGFRG